jgi:hypothetical protein
VVHETPRPDAPDADGDLAPGRVVRRARVVLTFMLALLALHVAGVIANGGRLASDHVFTWGGVPPEIQVRHGALVPGRVTGGETWRLLTGAGALGQGALGLVFGLLVLGGSGRRLERVVGSSRTLLVLVAATLAGALVRVAYVPESRFAHQAGWDPLLGLVGALVPLGLGIGGPEGRMLFHRSLAYLAFLAVLAIAIPGQPASHLWGEGAAVVAGALTLLLLGPRRSLAPAGTVVRGLGVVALLLVLGAVALQTRSALGGTDVRLASFTSSLRKAEDDAHKLWTARNPARVAPEARTDLGLALDRLRDDPVLGDVEGAAELRAYLEAMRPIATGELRDTGRVLKRLKEAFAAWKPHDDALHLRVGRSKRWAAPW